MKFLFFLFITTLSYSQTIREKTLVGYESLMWNKDKDGNETNYDFENKK